MAIPGGQIGCCGYSMEPNVRMPLKAQSDQRLQASRDLSKAIEDATFTLAMLLRITESEWEKAKHWRAWRAEVERQLSQ